LSHSPNYLAIEQGPGIKGTWVSPTPDLIVGDVKQWATEADVEAVRIPGYWIEKEGVDIPIDSPPQPGEQVLYALHGGGFVRLSASPNDMTSNIPKGILKHANTALNRAFTLEYRLSKPRSRKPNNPFPAALIDAIAGYQHLVHTVGFAPENIIVEGDSAGGNLAIALVRYLIENTGRSDIDIPRPPGALILCSPWVDLTPASTDPSSAVQYNIPSDFINVANRGTLSQIDDYCGPLSDIGGNTNRYISPASFTSPNEVSFKGFPRTFILGGGAEVLIDSIRLLRHRMTRDLGEDSVTYVEEPDAVHDFLVFIWHEPERTECLKDMAYWLENG
jgi:acetyl esterase/lipase